MQTNKFKYTILRNADGKYWLWFDEIGKVIDGVYHPNLQPYHELITNTPLREGSEVWTDELVSVPEMCVLRPGGQYSEAYVVKAKLKNESNYAAASAQSTVKMPSGKKPGGGQ